MSEVRNTLKSNTGTVVLESALVLSSALAGLAGGVIVFTGLASHFQFDSSVPYAISTAVGSGIAVLGSRIALRGIELQHSHFRRHLSAVLKQATGLVIAAFGGSIAVPRGVVILANILK